jgi:hypothetical protein
MRNKIKCGAVVRGTTFNGRNIFTAVKVSRQCPLVLLENVD